jgi:hypothetical protein
MAKAKTQDELVQKLIDAAQTKRKAIELAEKPIWLTNSSFSYDEDNSSIRRNIRVINNVGELVKIQAFLNQKESYYTDAAKELDYDQPFTWLGFSHADWTADFKVMATKINITKEKQNLEAIESRLDKLISPELKRQLELEAISKELGL